MRDHFEVMGEIDWHMIGPSTFRLDGQEMQSNDFLPSHGILRRFVSPLIFFSDLSFSTGSAHLLARMVARTGGTWYSRQ